MMEKEISSSSKKGITDIPAQQPSLNLYQPLQKDNCRSDEVYEDLNPEGEYELYSISNDHVQQQPKLQSLDLNQGHDGSNPQHLAGKKAEHYDIKLAVKRVKVAVIILVIVNIVVLLLVTTIATVVTHSKISKVAIQLNATNRDISKLAISTQHVIHNISVLQLTTADCSTTSRLSQLDAIQSNISHITEELTGAYNNITSVQAQVIALRTYVIRESGDLQLQLYCGPGEWHQVAYLNMSDPTQQCPSAWREYNTGGVRACGRPSASGGSSAAITYSIDFQYRRVCGRVVGYQFGSPDGFLSGNISQVYVDGISITRGSPREHVWTYAAGLTETASINGMSNCPCSTSPGSRAPSFVGMNYYCESGNPTGTFTSQLYTNDKLWDGKQCEGSCCTGANTPLWFSVQLLNTARDNIEVRILGNEGTSTEDTPVELVQMYVTQ